MEVSVVWTSVDIILERKLGPEFEGKKHNPPPKVTGNGLLMMAQEKLF